MRLPKLLALFLTTAITLGMSGQALALDVGQKGSFVQIDKELSQERQVEIARARYTMNPENPARMKELSVKFTINAQGDAYILMSDNMDDTKATMQIVYGKLKNARAYDPRNVGVLPAGIPVQSNLAKKIRSVAQDGDGVMIHGESVKKLVGGSEVVVGTTTVMANLKDTANRTIRDSIAILVTNKEDATGLDPVVANNLIYRGNQNLIAQP